jgi:hypothetical protein
MRVFYLIPLLCVALFLTLVVNPISYAQISVSSEWKARNVFENLPQSQTENITAQKVKNLSLLLLPASMKNTLYLQSAILRNSFFTSLHFHSPDFFRLARAPPV